MHRLFSFAALSLAICFAAPNTLTAQQPGVGQGVIAFDVNLGRLMSSDAVKQSGVNPGQMMQANPDESIDPNDVDRVFGAISAPSSVAEFNKGPGETPEMEFLMRMQFKTAELAKKSYEEMGAKGTPVTIGGKNYFRPPPDKPQNMLMHMFNDKTMEMGTEKFIKAGAANIFAPALLTQWKKLPADKAFRVAVDLNGVRHLINESMQNAGQIPPPAMPLVAMVENSIAVRIAFDLSSDNLLWLSLVGKDSAATQTLKASFDGMLMMASGFGKQSLAQIPSPNLQKTAGALLDALKTTQDGNDVNLVLPRPEGFEQAIQEVAGMFMGQLFGGGGPPAGF